MPCKRRLCQKWWCFCMICCLWKTFSWFTCRCALSFFPQYLCRIKWRTPTESCRMKEKKWVIHSFFFFLPFHYLTVLATVKLHNNCLALTDNVHGIAIKACIDSLSCILLSCMKDELRESVGKWFLFFTACGLKASGRQSLGSRRDLKQQ